jgi:cell wall-associated NlpC family hydrolase
MTRVSPSPSPRAALVVALALGHTACMQEASAQRRPAAARAQQSPLAALLAPRPPEPALGSGPATAAAARTIARIEAIERNLRVASYRHDTRVDERAGRYEFDCSGLIAWVLARSAPQAHRETLQQASGGRPLAADYARAFLRVRPEQQRGAWTRVARVGDARPGDVLAWIKPRIVRSNNTGHVVFVVGAPRRSTRYQHAWLVPIADSSRYRHQDDSREGSDRTGLGRGTIMITEDPATGAPRAFGWFGELSPYVLDTQIAIGRPER